MCGINGLFGIEAIPNHKETVGFMNDRLAHRGPDASGISLHDNACLGHRRLSIIDLSSSADQPMTDSSSRYTMVFNGEVYNYLEIKKKLSNHTFRTNSDTEVVIAAYAEWGPAALQWLNGMFALAIWDNDKKELFVARDRVGIKPLYYSYSNNSCVFSSELKGIIASEMVPAVLNKEVLPEYLAYATVHDPNTLLKDVYMLEAGHYMILKDTEHEIVKYWDPSKSTKSTSYLSKLEVEKQVRETLYTSVERRLVSDVPFGAFLSGGIDSSAMVGIMSEISSTQIGTFAVTFDDSEFSEAKYAKLVSEKFHTAHEEIRLKPQDFLELWPSALSSIDHPSSDGANTYVVSKVTKEKGITMAISGLGGDELFAGYDLFKNSCSAMNRPWISQYPMFLRKWVAKAYASLKPGVASYKKGQLLKSLRMELAYVYPIMRQVILDEDVHQLLPSNSKGNGMKERLLAHRSDWSFLPKLSQVSLAEMDTYMRSVLLRDTDQMSMAHALEVRVPFLDHELIELALGISDDIKYPHSPKALLIDSLEGLLPLEVVNRPKMGFTLPWVHWMKNELKEFCEFKMNSLAQRGILNSEATENLWKRFLKDDPRVSYSRILPLVVLENWIQENDVQT